MTTSNDGDDKLTRFSLRTSGAGDLALIGVSGILDESTAETLDQAALVAIDRGASMLTIDLTDLTAIDPHGVERLLALRITCALQRATVQFARPTRDLADALDDPRIRPPLQFTE